ncbi:hypothetical protein [Rhodobacter capsulatus]|uniref:hypothetical protein n=1 Tax=Rhodobacter capsulatus TaxID=1061 RepID=UPI004026286B
MALLTGKLDAGEISAADFERQMGDLIKKAQGAFASLGEIDDARFTKVIERLGGLWSALEALRTKAAEARAALPGGAATLDDTRGAAIAEARSGSYESSSPHVLTTSPRPKQPPPLLGETGPVVGSGQGAGAGGGRNASDFAQAVADLEREKAALDAEAAALVTAAAAGRGYAEAVDFARKRAELLTAAQREGKANLATAASDIFRRPFFEAWSNELKGHAYDFSYYFDEMGLAAPEYENDSGPEAYSEDVFPPEMLHEIFPDLSHGSLRRADMMVGSLIEAASSLAAAVGEYKRTEIKGIPPVTAVVRQP